MCSLKIYKWLRLSSSLVVVVVVDCSIARLSQSKPYIYPFIPSSSNTAQHHSRGEEGDVGEYPSLGISLVITAFYFFSSSFVSK